MKHLVLGGPGAGKTSKLLSIMEQELERGTPPDRIAFVSFTRKAINEAVDRARTKFGLKADDLPYFRTLHSLCYHELGITNNEVLNKKHYKRIGDALGIDVKGDYNLFDSVTSLSTGDRFLFMDSYARSTKKCVQEVWRTSDADFTWFDLKQFLDTVKDYKDENCLVDFTDLLELYVQTCLPLSVEVAIIDEAQDLNALQWDVAWHATKKAKRTYIAGDDDQAIYRWSGADINQFLNIREDLLEVLPVSYRLPREIFDFASGIASKISKRYTKDWESRPGKGGVNFVREPEYVDLNNHESWLLLARNTHLLKPYMRMAEEQGVAYTTRNGSSINKKDVDAIRYYEKLRLGETIKANSMNLVLDKLGRRPIDLNNDKMYGLKDVQINGGEIWHDALVGIPLSVREYYLSILRRGGKLTDPPKIHIDTIHSTKGGEADNVILMTDLTRKTYNNFYREEDDEHRVFYVGATRARKNLIVVLPQSSRFYPI